MKNKINSKKRNGSITITILVCIGVIVALIFLFGSDRSKAAFEVAKDNAENKLVASVGKIEVAEKLAAKRISDIKNKLIKVKAAKRSILRAMENPKLTQSQKDRYSMLIAKLDEVDARATKAYQNANQKFEELRATLEVVETETEIAKTTTSILGYDSKNSVSEKDLEKTIKSIYADLDSANAELDVAIIDAK